MSQYSFQRHQRLLSSRDFKTVFDGVEGRVSHSAFLLLARRIPSDQPARLGIVAAKKHLKRAVDRNRFKRIVRDTFRLSQHQLQGIELIVLARPGSKDVDNGQLAEQLNKYWPRLVQRCHNPKSGSPT